MAVGLIILVNRCDKKRLNNMDKLLKEDHIEAIKTMAKKAIKEKE